MKAHMTKIRLTLLVTAAWMALSSCMLDRSAIASFEPDFTVDPAFFCPGESVTLSWDLPTGEPCYIGRRSAGVTEQCSHVTSIDPVDLVGDFVFNEESTQGSRTVTPPGTTTFTMHEWIHTDRTSGTTTAEVTATQIDGSGIIPVTFPGACRRYSGVDLRETLSACLAITQICLPPDAPSGTYQVMGTRSSNPESFNLVDLSAGPGGTLCADVAGSFNGVDGLFLTFRPNPPSAAPPGGGDCTTSGAGILPDLTMNIAIGCNSGLLGCEMGGMGGGVDPEEATPPPTAAPNGSQQQATGQPTTVSDACAQFNSTTEWVNPGFCSCQGITYTITQCVNGQRIEVPNANSSCTPDPAQCQTSTDGGGDQPTQGPTCEFKCYVADPNKPEQCQQGGWVYPGTDTPCNPNNP